MENTNQNMAGTQNVPKRNLPRDVFLHLLAIVTLYLSSIFFITLLWQIINNFFPDNLYNNYQGYVELLRTAVSFLIVAFPVFVGTSWFLNKIYKKEAIVRESKIRKWLLYFTLFVSALVTIGDLIAVVRSLLGGETTMPFILKTLSVLVVAGLVFWYYLDDVRKSEPTKLAKPFAWGSGILVLVGIISSFFVIGSPVTARLIQYDNQKISDLQIIQQQIVSYWQAKEKLPATLQDLNDPIKGYKVPSDPQTDKPYEYNIKDAVNLSFELCANFNKDNNVNAGQKRMSPVLYDEFGGYYNIHGSGYVCFQRAIDKQLYPPIPKTIIK